MKILIQALSKINILNKNQYDFFIVLIQGFIGITGKRTFRNLARYMQIDEHTFSRQMAKAFNFIGLNTEMIKSSKNNGEILIAAQDASFMQKSGKSTHGLGFFWNGCASKAEKGLELDEIAIIKINGDKKEGYHLSAQQTPSNGISKADKKKKKIGEPTRIDHYLQHAKQVLPQLIELGIRYMAFDAFLAKDKYVNGLVELGLHGISKLRMDARLKRLYTGPQKARGRKRLFDNGSIGFNDFKDADVVKVNDEDEGVIELRQQKLYSVSLKRIINVVSIRKYKASNEYGEIFLFSTDLELSAIQIYQYYAARFQIEFIFRDAKGFTGLTDFQTRDARRIHFHINASLTALNVAKLQDAAMQQEQDVQHAFSMTNWARKYHVDIIINRFISMFGFDQTSIKSHPDYESFLSFGNITH